MFRVKAFVLICLFVLTAGAAASASESGFYAYADAGFADVERSFGSVDSVDGSETGITVGGGYAFNRHMALQAAYRRYADVRGTVGCPPELLCIADLGTSLVPFSVERVDLTGGSLEVKASLPLGDGPFALTGKVGALVWDLDGDSTPQLDDSGTDWLAGVGARWDSGSRWSVQIGYEWAGVGLRSTTVGGLLRF